MNLNDPAFVQLIWMQFWQCSLLVLVVYLMCRLFRFRRAHLSFLLWLLVLLKFMTPPLWTSSSGLFCWVQQPFNSEMRQEPINQGSQSLTLTESIRLMTGGDLRKLPDVETESSPFEVTIRDVDSNEDRDVQMDQGTLITEAAVIKTERRPSHYSIMDVGLIVWALIAAMIVGVMSVRYWRCKRMIRCAGEQHHPELNQLLERLCKELKVKRRVRLLITKSRMGPAVMGLFRPTIILPEVITGSCSLKELEPILAHELIHIRRGDLWVGLLQLLASVVWWFHPLVWLSGRCLKFEIEQCCDEEVLAELKCDPGLYAKCLLEVLELKQSLKTVPVVPGVRPVEITSKRLERIMKLGQGCQKRTPWWCWMIFVTLAAVVLPGAAFMVSADDLPPKVLQPSQTEETAIGQKTETGPIQSLPFYDELKQVANSNKRFRNMYSTDLSYLSPEIDMRDWVSRTGRIRTYPIKELLEQTRKAVGPARAEQVLEKKLNARISEIREIWATNHKPTHNTGAPFFFETVQVPLKDERKQYRMIVYGGSCIRNDQLIVWAKDDQYHRHVEQALVELAVEEFMLLELNVKFIAVPRSLLDKISSQRKSIKVFQMKQVPAVAEGTKPGELVSVGAETVSRPSLISEVLDGKRINEVQQLILSSASCQVLSAPRVRFLDGQTVQFETKNRSVFEIQLAGAGEQVSVTNSDAGFATHVKYSESKGINQRGMLDYQIAYSEIDGLTKQKMLDEKTGQEKEVEVPSITERHFKDASLMKPGQVLLVGGLELHQETDEPKVLLVMFHVKKVKPLEEDQAMFGVGVNSDAGVTGQVIIDESNFQKNLITINYPVADLVVPVPRKFFNAGAKPGPVPPMPQPRFEPLIELIKQNVTPEAWDDSKQPDSTIMPYPKMLALVVRHTREGHEELTELLMKLRAVQDVMLQLNLQVIAAEDMQGWLKGWDLSESPDARHLLEQLQAQNLDEGIVIDSKQVEILKQMSEQAKHVNCLQLSRLALFNGQSTELSLFGEPPPQKKPEYRVQLRPELLKDQNIRLSFAINAKDALDVLSHLKSKTIPEESSMLVDVTDHITGEESAFLFSQWVRQSQLNYRKKPKRCFLLITPSVLKNSENR